jgi:hypothetical protein
VDLSVVDLSVVDLSVVDLSVGDLAVGDLAVGDLAEDPVCLTREKPARQQRVARASILRISLKSGLLILSTQAD